MDDPVAMMRMLERIIAVLIGGLAIYLGYRLFFHLPFENNHEGQLELPGVKIVLSRVGPGVFFAAFGSLVLYYSFTEEVKIERSDGASFFSGVSGAGTSDFDVTPQQRSKALTTIEMLNCAQRLLAGEGSSRDLKDQFSVAIRESKRALLLSVWNEDDWGPVDQLGVTGFTKDAPFQLRNMFNATYKDCPK